MSASSVTVAIDGGVLRFVYADDLAPLLDLGSAVVTRASHVEPAPTGGWTADLAPSGGPLLGPFHLRAEALDAERKWLWEHRGL